MVISLATQQAGPGPGISVQSLHEFESSPFVWVGFSRSQCESNSTVKKKEKKKLFDLNCKQ